MELVMSSEGKPTYRGRLLTRPNPALNLETARLTPFAVEEDAASISMLHRFLGLNASPTVETRLHELSFWSPAYEWACRETDRRRPSIGAEIVGTAALKVVRDAYELRARDVAQLTSATAVALGPATTTDRELNQAISTFHTLLTDVRLITRVDDVTGALLDAYQCDDLVALAAAEALAYSRMGERLVKCAHCLAWFIPNQRADEVYCWRAAPGQPAWGHTCQQIGPQRRYARESDDLTKEYRRRYKLLDGRARRGRLDRSELNQWREQARALLARARSRTQSIAAFEKALDAIEPISEE